MLINPIIEALRVRCPVFQNRVAGAAKFDIGLSESAKLAVPCAYVLPLDDSPEDNTSANGLRQKMVEAIAVVVVVSNVADERGQASADQVEGLRRILWRALLGWSPSTEHDGFTFQGGTLLKVDRARLWFQFEFGAEMVIDSTDGWQDEYLSGLPPFHGVEFRMDCLDPADSNAATAPDGRVEVHFSAPKSGNLPE